MPQFKLIPDEDLFHNDNPLVNCGAESNEKDLIQTISLFCDQENLEPSQIIDQQLMNFKTLPNPLQNSSLANAQTYPLEPPALSLTIYTALFSHL
uniref:Uncharacterized protein n=1 Tax=Romanomermis culicivorax TaxID=13658 RepID=A0A915I9D7_ROMCU